MKRDEYQSAQDTVPAESIQARFFEVTLVNGVKKTIIAHFCDSTSSPAGHIIFVEVDKFGVAWHRYIVQRDLFMWVEEIFTERAVPGVH